MICPRCHGRHVIWDNHGWITCPDCGGYGEWNCCEGLQEQPAAATCPLPAGGSAAESQGSEPLPPPGPSPSQSSAGPSPPGPPQPPSVAERHTRY